MARNKKRNKKAPKTVVLGVEDMATIMRRRNRDAELARGGRAYGGPIGGKDSKAAKNKKLGRQKVVNFD